MRVGDLATGVAADLQDQHLDALLASGEPVVDEEEPMRAEARRSVFAKIEFKWRSSDAQILDQIRAAVDRVFKELFDEAIVAVDVLYEEMRIPETQVIDGERVVLRDGSGRVIWQKDSRGNEVEDWGQMTGQDLEQCLADISRIRLALAPQLNDLLLEAVFAKHIADDAYSDAYAGLLDGTIPDRNAYASRTSRQDKYHAFFRYYLYSHAEAFMKELNNFARVLDRILYFRINAREGRGGS